MRISSAFFAAAATAVLVMFNSSAANATSELQRKYNCTGCHVDERKLVGPSYKEVAAKYKGKKDAEVNLITKVKNGGSGVWGPVPMPPNASVPDEDLKELVKFILAMRAK